MTSGRITIDVGLETRGVAKGAKDAEKALGDLEDAVGDTGREGGRDLDKIEDELKDVQRQSDKTGRDVGRNLDDGFDKAKKGADDFKQEANSTAREAAASFDGSAESIGDAFQEVAANAFSGFGPLGAAAGIAAAAGLGVITTTLQQQQQEADELKSRLSDAYKTAAEEGRGFLDTAQIIADASDLMFNPDRAEEWKRVQEDAKLLGLDTYDVISANAGELDAQRELQERINTLLEDTGGKASEYAAELLLAKKRWGDINTETKNQQENASKLAEIVGKAEQAQRDQIKRTNDAAQSRYEGLAKLYGKPIKGTLEVDVVDRTGPGVQRIVNRINGRIASIQISAGIGGKQLL